jgi:hypothetical protein
MAIIKPWVLGASTLLALGLSGVSLAGTLAAQSSLSGTVVGFTPSRAHSGGTLTVVGPGGFVASVSSKRGLPLLDLAQFGSVPDGQYTYQLDAATSQVDTSRIMQNNGRAKKANVRPRRSDSLSGVFVVKGGSIVVAPLAAGASRGGSDRDQD